MICAHLCNIHIYAICMSCVSGNVCFLFCIHLQGPGLDSKIGKLFGQRIFEGFCFASFALCFENYALCHESLCLHLHFLLKIPSFWFSTSKAKRFREATVASFEIPEAEGMPGMKQAVTACAWHWPAPKQGHGVVCSDRAFDWWVRLRLWQNQFGPMALSWTSGAFKEFHQPTGRYTN